MKTLVAAMALVAFASLAAGEEARDWAVEDSIAVRYYVRDLQQSDLLQFKWNPIVPSPDQKHFFIISRHGDLARDCNVHELQVFGVDELLKGFASGKSLSMPPQPVARAEICSGSSAWSGMSNPVWRDDQRIVFLGQEGEQARNVFQLDIRTSALQQLTHASMKLNARLNGVYAFSLGGNSIVYDAPASVEPMIPPYDAYPAAAIVSLNKALRSDAAGDLGLFASYHASPEYRLDVPPNSRIVSVSPDGRWVMLKVQPDDEALKQAWKGYAGIDPSRSYQFMVWDIQNRRGRALFPAPVGSATTDGSSSREVYDVENPWALLTPATALWSADGARVIVTNTALPLDARMPERRRTAYIIDYELASGKWSILEPIADMEAATRAGKVGWLTPGKELLIEKYEVPEGRLKSANAGVRTDGVVYSLRGNRWVKRVVAKDVNLPLNVLSFSKEDVVLPGGLSVNVQQDFDTPPAVIAMLRGREWALSEPDPALTGIWRAHGREVKWTEPGGYVSKGLLLLPRESDGKPPPLVIHAYYGSPDAFRPDGISTTAYAAQPLVAQGFAVLFVDIPAIDRKETSGTPREGQTMVDRIDAAVASLAGQGLVDARRVGLVGFSRAAYMTYYAVTHPKEVTLAAAIVADGVTFSLGEQAIEYARFSSPIRMNETLDTDERIYGGSFATATAARLEHDPSLNAHRARTPTLFAYNGRSEVFRVSTMLGYFRVAGCPAEFLLFPDGAHQLVRPRERQASLQATVDWMNFWLKGIESPGSAGDEKYARWRTMKEHYRHKTAATAVN